MQRKKSLPDVAALPTVAVKAGTQVMTREEISVLSSARQLRHARHIFQCRPEVHSKLQLVLRAQTTLENGSFK
jgi:hypothetical protein